MKKYTFFLLFSTLLLCNCVSNDFEPEYQKELLYDGYGIAIDTVGMKTYIASQTNDSISKKQLYDETTKWYDQNGYHSMTHSVNYLPGGERITTEKITRDKYSLPIAKDIIIESAATEPLVTLSRLKSRKDGKEEWLFRHYLDPQKYLEDASTILYSEDKRIFKKQQGSDSLQIRGIDLFDNKGRITEQLPVNIEEKAPFTKTYYNPSHNYIDSIVSVFYEHNDSTQTIIEREVERYGYDWNEDSTPWRKYTYSNDSLVYVTEYEYGYRQ